MTKILTENEKRLIEKVKIPEYYNKKITILDTKFRPMVGLRASSICPFHDDTDPSLHYWKEKELFRCFGCHEVGDVIKMHQLIEKTYHNRTLTREQSMKELGKIYNIELEFDEGGELIAPSPIELAKKKITDRSQYNLKINDINTLSPSNFRVFNNQIKNNTRLSTDIKIKNYQRLDIMLSAYIMKVR